MSSEYYTATEIAELVGFSQRHVRRTLVKLGIKPIGKMPTDGRNAATYDCNALILIKGQSK